jgi:hypothetical protein
MRQLKRFAGQNASGGRLGKILFDRRKFIFWASLILRIKELSWIFLVRFCIDWQK